MRAKTVKTKKIKGLHAVCPRVVVVAVRKNDVAVAVPKNDVAVAVRKNDVAAARNVVLVAAAEVLVDMVRRAADLEVVVRVADGVAVRVLILTAWTNADRANRRCRKRTRNARAKARRRRDTRMAKTKSTESPGAATVRKSHMRRSNGDTSGVKRTETTVTIQEAVGSTFI